MFCPFTRLEDNGILPLSKLLGWSSFEGTPRKSSGCNLGLSWPIKNKEGKDLEITNFSFLSWLKRLLKFSAIFYFPTKLNYSFSSLINVSLSKPHKFKFQCHCMLQLNEFNKTVKIYCHNNMAINQSDLMLLGNVVYKHIAVFWLQL